MDFYCVCTPRIDPKKCPNTYERVQCTSSKRIGNEPIPEGENFHPRGWKNAPMITFYHLFESIYGLSGSIDKGLTSQGRGGRKGGEGTKIAAIEPRQFSMIVLIAFIIEHVTSAVEFLRDWCRRVRLFRGRGMEKKEGREGGGGEEKRRKKREKREKKCSRGEGEEMGVD